MTAPPPDYAATIGASSAKPAYEGELLPIPDYLEKYYWWAYVRPWSMRIFEREWLINLILIGWYKQLRDAGLAALGHDLPGRTLQVSCCYGSFTPTLMQRVNASGGTLDVIDVSPEQLKNLRRKLGTDSPARIMLRNSEDLKLPDTSYDRVILFFLPHEQPKDVRANSFAEAWRVLKPGGQLLIVEFGKPKWWHPLKYFYLPFLKFLEPFAPDIWGHDMTAWLPKEWLGLPIDRESFFGGYYQRLVIRKPN